MGYPKLTYVMSRATAVLQPNRAADKAVVHPRALPGNIILVHGVNDVGTGFSAVEEGLCAGLEKRLLRPFKPAVYSMPTAADKEKLVDDPDAKYFKRTVATDTVSPVIPFYWGFREVQAHCGTINGQFTDRYGNRLDKDLSKGGGPFANATSTLPDMWNRGVGAPTDPVGDPMRPVRNAPGRMYMVLAACRLAALISMIRDYEATDTVTIVAHSQGCLLSLLAQAILMEKGERTADTLILTHPPYSLDEEVSVLMKAISLTSGGDDAAMRPFYDLISDRQSMHARLQTLINIVQGVAKSKGSEPSFSSLGAADRGGMVHASWRASDDRDNRGKVYLYFCPEDMTVSLDNVRGIGWQGVPDFVKGHAAGFRLVERYIGRSGVEVRRSWEWRSEEVTRLPLQALGSNFRQRVFTAKHRLNPALKADQPVLVGQAPHDFPLRVKGEDDQNHVAASGRSFRERLPEATWPIDPHALPEQQRYGIRRITGEALGTPCAADMRGNQIAPDQVPRGSLQARVPMHKRGPYEEVDPITAATALTSAQGLATWMEELPDPSGKLRTAGSERGQRLPDAELAQMSEAYNREKQPLKTHPDDQHKVVLAILTDSGKVIAGIQESRNAARLRWQQELSAKSFHSAIFNSSYNHQHVTAYDVAIGSGAASTHPLFYAYLCAVADWRLKKPIMDLRPRPGILRWPRFLELHNHYFAYEREWRRDLIEGNAEYYSTGILPDLLPVLTGPLWNIVVSETISGKRINRPAAPPSTEV